MIYILSIKSAREIASILLSGIEEDEIGHPFTEMQQSAIVEFGNIITSSFIDVWANTLSIEVDQNPPTFACNCMSAILDNSLGAGSESGDFAFMFDSLLSIIDRDIDLEVLMLPEMSSLQKIFDNLPPELEVIP